MDNITKIVDHFISSNEPKQIGQYATDGKTLVYVKAGKESRYIKDCPINVQRDVLAIKSKGIVLGNSARLEHVESMFGRRTRGQTRVQAIMAEKIPTIPFNVFKEAKLNLRTIKVLDNGQGEKITRFKMNEYGSRHLGKDGYPVFETVHFTGAKLFEVDGRQFLFDLDREEIKHNIFNPFLVELQTKASSIVEAYESLKPQAVKDALSKGSKVIRQGEWFFIPTKQPSQTFIDKHYKKVKDWNKKMILPELSLRAGNNRPNIVKLGFEANAMVYVKGLVRHQGREHRDVTLTQWHLAVPNTSVTSWQVSGDID